MTEPAPDNGGQGASTVERRVTFQHPFFARVGKAFFQLSGQNNEPVMVVGFGRNGVLLPFPGICREFQLGEDHPDARMLADIAKALQYVKGLSVGDPLPREMLDRKASWALSARHRAVAAQRIRVQLVNWMTGGQDVVTDPEELLKLAETPAVKRQVNEAFAEAAERLGFGRDHRDEVVRLVETLANELAYIEALRDRYRAVREMEEKIQGFRRIYGRDRSIFEIADQLARLGGRAVESFAAAFAEVDAQTGEILSVLKNLDLQINYIRDMRDELHRRLMAWDDILAEWKTVSVHPSDDKPQLLRRAYQFLAPRYMQVSEWVLMTKLQQQGHTATPFSHMGPPPNLITSSSRPSMDWGSGDGNS